MLLLTLLVAFSPPLQVGCDSAAPAGLYEGRAVSRQSGPLDVTLNLRCAGRELRGAMLTPVGNFGLRRVETAEGSVTIQFDASGDVGVIRASVSHDSLNGVFAVSGDSGIISLRRIGRARERDIPVETLALTAQQWREDIDYFARELPARHADAFAQYPRQQFQAEIAALRASVDTLTADQVYVRLDAIANRVGDGHTFVALPADHAMMPIIFRQFDSAYRVVAASSELTESLGARVLAVDGHDIGVVRAALMVLTPVAETEQLRDARVTNFLRTGAMLHGLGLADSASVITYELVSAAGRRFTVRARAVAATSENDIVWRYVFPSQPLYRQHEGESFWFAYLAASRTVYCNWRAYDSLDARAAKLFALIDSVHPAKVMIDLRQNGGGDYTLGLKYVVAPFAARKDVNDPKRLFVAIGPNTFSAGMSNAAQFRSLTRATLVGEPIGERPNSYQEAREMRLPNSWLMVRYSTQFYHFADTGPNEIRPNVLVPTSWAEYKAGRDPVVDWVVRR
jgi:hypothetical protein